jgi:anhydro-N-acetylmuramic acid kinase
MRARVGAPYDDFGDVAATGTPDKTFVDNVLNDDFFALKPPKSLDRNSFAFANIGLPNYSVPDGAPTLSALTVQAIGRIVPFLPAAPKAWIVAGGGARNRTLMKMLGERLAPARWKPPTKSAGRPARWKRRPFAFLAVRALNKLPYTFPTTTGVKQAMTGGVVADPRG